MKKATKEKSNLAFLGAMNNLMLEKEKNYKLDFEKYNGPLFRHLILDIKREKNILDFIEDNFNKIKT